MAGVTLSTHILDTEVGEPAGGVKVGLFRGKDLISLQETDEDGRIQMLPECGSGGLAYNAIVIRRNEI